MKILDFKGLIANLPERNHSVTSKISTWDNNINNNLEDALAFIKENYRKDKDNLEISRKDLYELGRSEKLDEFILATIIWGYPSGMRGGNFEKVLTNYQNIKDLLIDKKINGISQWQNEINLISNIKGLGISSYTKLLNFLNVRVEGKKALILDSRVMGALNSGRFTDLQMTVSYDTGFRNYLLYLDKVHAKAVEINVKPEKIEMFLFFFGASLK